jgi:hypothetical protein
VAASQEAIAANHQVALLAQRLEALEKRDSIQDGEIKSLTASAKKLEGADDARTRDSASSAKWIGPAVTGLMFVISLGVGGGIYGQLGALGNQVAALEVSKASKEERLKILEAKKSPDLTDINSSLAKFDTRVSTVENTQLLMQARSTERDRSISEIRQNLSSNDAQTTALEQRIMANARTIEELGEQSKINIRNIAAIDSKTSAGFVEVESQLRGTTAMLSVVIDSINEKIGTLWHKVIGQPLPESKTLPSNIPAQATTDIGGAATQ